MSEKYHVVLEDCFKPATVPFIRSISHELNREFGEGTSIVTKCPMSLRLASRPFNEMVELAAENARRAALDDDTMAIYVLPTTVGYSLNDAEGLSGLLITVAAMKSGPVGVYIDFPDGPETPKAVIDHVSDLTKSLSATTLKNMRVTKEVTQRTSKVMNAVSEGLTHWTRFYQ